MKKIRNLEWLRAETCRILSVDPTNIDSAFQGTSDDPWEFLDVCINEAYEDEITEIANDSDPERVLEFMDLSWPSTSRTLKLPPDLSRADILSIEDWTHTSPGTSIRIASRNSGYEPWVSWLDKDTLQWGQTGPGETKTIRVFYLGRQPPMINPGDEPRYIPDYFRWVLIWGAAINARVRQGEAAPQEWYVKREDWRNKMHIEFSKGRPRYTNPPQQQASGNVFDNVFP